MRCWKNPWLEGFCTLLLALWLGVWPGAARADAMVLRDVAFGLAEDGYELSFNADFELAHHLEQMLERGVTLPFRVELEVFRPRWYWLDERAIRKTASWRLSYNELTRQYRVASGDFLQSFSTLREALKRLSRIRNLNVGDAKALSQGVIYEARLRYYLDPNQLPKPLQLSAFTSSEWDLGSDARAWRVLGGAPVELAK